MGFKNTLSESVRGFIFTCSYSKPMIISPVSLCVRLKFFFLEHFQRAISTVYGFLSVCFRLNSNIRHKTGTHVFWENGVDYPRVSPGAHPLANKPEDSGYEIVWCTVWHHFYMWLLDVSLKEYVQTHSLVWSFLTPVRRLECHNFSPQARTAILAAFSPLQRSHMRRRLTAVFHAPTHAPHMDTRWKCIKLRGHHPLYKTYVLWYRTHRGLYRYIPGSLYDEQICGRNRLHKLGFFSVIWLAN